MSADYTCTDPILMSCFGIAVHIISYIIIIIDLFYVLFSNSAVSHGKLVQCQALSTAGLCLEHIRANLKLL